MAGKRKCVVLIIQDATKLEKVKQLFKKFYVFKHYVLV